jgi:hypothetical protein
MSMRIKSTTTITTGVLNLQESIAIASEARHSLWRFPNYNNNNIFYLQQKDNFFSITITIIFADSNNNYSNLFT